MRTSQPYALVLEDHLLVGRGVAQYLLSIRPDWVVQVASQWGEAMRLMQVQGEPQLVVADVWLAQVSSLDRVGAWRGLGYRAPWLAISADEDPGLSDQVMAVGAQGFVLKQSEPAEFAQAVYALANGHTWFKPRPLSEGLSTFVRDIALTPADLGLTARQGEILQLVLRAMPNKRIALMLGISESTVKEHLTGIFRRLGVRTRMEVITHLKGRRLTLGQP